MTPMPPTRHPRALRVTALIAPWIGVLAVLLIGAGLYTALFASPPDYRQGDSVRMMYVHVPSAWIGMAAYCLIAVMSALFLLRKSSLASLTAEAAALPGAVFTFLCLATGSLWGKPMWGVWWSWDARLTSMLILLFLYIGYMALINAFDDRERGEHAGAILALAGAVNIPIIKFSVDWWRTLHQPSSLIRSSGIAIDPAMLRPLLLMVAGFTAFFAALLLLRLHTAILAATIREARLTADERD
ncbi:MAG: heme ABC transporter permease CcmC [Rhodospirillaceae bacterium]|nr:heme ABC transporter permease CcmC [Rhodospirillaceae bacterium]